MPVYDRISDLQDRVRPYIQPYVKSTPRVSPTVSRSYINRMESFETVPKSYIQHPINTRMSQDHGMLQTSAHTVSYDRHTTNTVHIRYIHGRHGIVRVYTVSHCLVRSYTASTSARTVQKKDKPNTFLQSEVLWNRNIQEYKIKKK
jgi:hypothetical protein